MSSFMDKNWGGAPARKLTPDDVVRAVQMAITSKCETIRIYRQILSGTDNAVVRDVIAELADDDMHHAGALLKLLYTLSPDAAHQYEIGAGRVLSDLGLGQLTAE